MAETNKNNSPRSQVGTQNLPNTSIPSGLSILQFEKIRVTEAYYRSLQEANQDTLKHFQSTLHNSSIAYIVSITTFALTYLVAIVSIIIGFVFLFIRPNNNQLWAGGCVAGGIILLIIMINRDPIQKAYTFINNLTRLNVVYTGFIRQIHQVDAAFGGMFLYAEGFDMDKVEEMLLRSQGAVNSTLESINQIMDEVDL